MSAAKDPQLVAHYKAKAAHRKAQLRYRQQWNAAARHKAKTGSLPETILGRPVVVDPVVADLHMSKNEVKNKK